MALEQIGIQIPDYHRVIVADVHPERLDAIRVVFAQLGLTMMSPSTWTSAPDVMADQLILAIGELAQDECVYVIAQGEERLNIRGLAAPRTRRGIMVGE
jgi:hypothetical protein